jgi:hypothetical protein
MKCVPREEGMNILEEIHKGVCGNHVFSRTLVSKAFRRAFYLSTALADAEELVNKLPRMSVLCQTTNVPTYKLTTIPST